MMRSGPHHRTLCIASGLSLVVLVALLSPLDAQTPEQPTNLVVLVPIVDLHPTPEAAWLPPAILRGLTYTFGRLASIELLDQSVTQEALKAENLKPGQEVDEAQARVLGRKLKADLVVVTAFELKEDETVSLSVRLTETNSDTGTGPLAVEDPADRLLDALATVTMQTASLMNYRISADERHALKHPPTSSFRSFADYQRALAAYDPTAGTGNLAEAMALLATAVERDPHFAEARFQLGLLAARQGRSDQAASHLQRLVQNNPSYPNAQHNLGLAKLNQGEYDPARTELLKAYQAHPERVNLLNDLAMAAYYLKDYTAAERYLTTASELAPTSSVIWNNLGTVAYAQGDFTETQRAYEKAIQHNPKSVSAHYNLGLTYLQVAELDKAKEAFEKTLELDPRHAKTYYSLALIAESDGTGKAPAYWHKYLELAKEDPAEQPSLAVAQRALEKQPASPPPQP
ncbi:MAG: tetratricopeptide repeat protein [Nitrospinota bacterium]